MGMQVEEAPEDALPKCPSCSRDLDTIWVKTKGLGIVQQKQVIMCPHCRVCSGTGPFD